MTEKDFRAMHSELIGYYQLIEMRLKGLCAAILADEERNWFERLNDYEYDSFGILIHKITEIQEKQHLKVLEPRDLASLDDLRRKRNYWVHQCFEGDPPIDRVTFSSQGRLKNQMHAQKLRADLYVAIEWDEKLAALFCNLNSGI